MPGGAGGADLAVIAEGGGTDRVLYRVPVAAGATFVLSYVHSSEHVRVRGTFRVDVHGGFTVVETAFAGFGPGLPHLTQGDDWRVEDGMIVHRPHEGIVRELIVRVLPSTCHRFLGPDGRTIDLSATLPPGSAVRIDVR